MAEKKKRPEPAPLTRAEQAHRELVKLLDKTELPKTHMGR
jgi:hypothetical protein